MPPTCMVCCSDTTEADLVMVAIDRQIKLGLREPRHGTVHEQCVAEGERQALDEGLNWIVGSRWRQPGVPDAHDEAAVRRFRACAICGREVVGPWNVLTGIGQVCVTCVSELVSGLVGTIDNLDRRRRVPLARGTAFNTATSVRTSAFGGAFANADSNGRFEEETDEQEVTDESLRSFSYSLRLVDPGGIVTTVTLDTENEGSRYLIRQVGPDGQSFTELAISVPSDDAAPPELLTDGHPVLVPHFIFALRGIADSVLEQINRHSDRSEES